MDSEVLISVEGVRKKFCRSLKRSLWYGMQDMASELCGGSAKHEELRKNEFWAVNDVSFELRRGECLGLIGRNGAGKTTLLKMLNGLIKPDAGRITMRGRVGALIALGAGFNPILTGRENIYVNASILGLTKRETDAKLDEIIGFAEIGEFIDSPVQSYSSGMQVRLGFAVASCLDPDILIADEVLAVGDANFRSKCYRRLAEMRERGTTVLFVSHQMTDVQRICTRCLWLVNGEVAGSGETPGVVSQYLTWTDTQSPIQAGAVLPEPTLIGAKILSVQTLDGTGRETSAFKTGQPLRIRLEYEVSSEIDGLNFSLSINTSEEALYNGYASLFDGLTVYPTGSHGHVELTFPELCLGAGSYWVSAGLSDKNYLGVYDWSWQATQFIVNNEHRMLGRFALPHYWQSSELGEQRRFAATSDGTVGGR